MTFGPSISGEAPYAARAATLAGAKVPIAVCNFHTLPLFGKSNGTRAPV
jgi:hypothetical protein